MTDRMKKLFDASRRDDEPVLIGYLTAGDPAIGSTVECALDIIDAGVGLVELGVPYSDPLADGPVLQEAADRSLKAGTRPHDVLNMAAAIRERSDAPVVLLVYVNTLLSYGYRRFLQRAAQCGVDGIVVPDLPVEHRQELLASIRKEQTTPALIPLVSPASGAERIRATTQGMRGFVYCVAYAGVTGEQGEHKTDLDYLDEVARCTDLPRAVGFGIRTRSDIQRLEGHAEAVIVGTRLMEEAVRSDRVGLKRFVSELIGRV